MSMSSDLSASHTQRPVRSHNGAAAPEFATDSPLTAATAAAANMVFARVVYCSK